MKLVLTTVSCLLLFRVVGAANAQTQEVLSQLAAENREMQGELFRMENKFTSLLSTFESLKDRALIAPKYCDGRLTVTSLTPVEPGNGSSGTTLYFTPYKGSRISLYNGSRWRIYTLSEISITYAGAGLVNNAGYDVFIYDNAGTLTLEFSAQWTNALARANALALQDGVYVKNSDKTRRYLGTVHTVSNAFFNTYYIRTLWNYCNRIETSVYSQDLTDTWSSTAITWTGWDTVSASSLARITVGIADSLLKGRVTFTAGSAASQTDISTGMSVTTLASASANSALLMGASADPNVPRNATAEYWGYPPISHYLYLHGVYITTGTSTTFYGDNGLTTGWLRTAQRYTIEN